MLTNEGKESRTWSFVATTIALMAVVAFFGSSTLIVDPQVDENVSDNAETLMAMSGGWIGVKRRPQRNRKAVRSGAGNKTGTGEDDPPDEVKGAQPMGSKKPRNPGGRMYVPQKRQAAGKTEEMGINPGTAEMCIQLDRDIAAELGPSQYMPPQHNCPGGVREQLLDGVGSEAFNWYQPMDVTLASGEQVNNIDNLGQFYGPYSPGVQMAASYGLDPRWDPTDPTMGYTAQVNAVCVWSYAVGQYVARHFVPMMIIHDLYFKYLNTRVGMGTSWTGENPYKHQYDLYYNQFDPAEMGIPINRRAGISLGELVGTAVAQLTSSMMTDAALASPKNIVIKRSQFLAGFNSVNIGKVRDIHGNEIFFNANPCPFQGIDVSGDRSIPIISTSASVDNQTVFDQGGIAWQREGNPVSDLANWARTEAALPDVEFDLDTLDANVPNRGIRWDFGYMSIDGSTVVEGPYFVNTGYHLRFARTDFWDCSKPNPADWAHSEFNAMCLAEMTPTCLKRELEMYSENLDPGVLSVIRDDFLSGIEMFAAIENRAMTPRTAVDGVDISPWDQWTSEKNLYSEYRLGFNPGKQLKGNLGPFSIELNDAERAFFWLTKSLTPVERAALIDTSQPTDLQMVIGNQYFQVTDLAAYLSDEEFYMLVNPDQSSADKGFKSLTIPGFRTSANNQYSVQGTNGEFDELRGAAVLTLMALKAWTRPPMMHGISTNTRFALVDRKSPVAGTSPVVWDVDNANDFNLLSNSLGWGIGSYLVLAGSGAPTVNNRLMDGSTSKGDPVFQINAMDQVGTLSRRTVRLAAYENLLSSLNLLPAPVSVVGSYATHEFDINPGTLLGNCIDGSLSAQINGKPVTGWIPDSIAGASRDSSGIPGVSAMTAGPGMLVAGADRALYAMPITDFSARLNDALPAGTKDGGMEILIASQHGPGPGAVLDILYENVNVLTTYDVIAGDPAGVHYDYQLGYDPATQTAADTVAFASLSDPSVGGSANGRNKTDPGQVYAVYAAMCSQQFGDDIPIVGRTVTVQHMLLDNEVFNAALPGDTVGFLKEAAITSWSVTFKAGSTTPDTIVGTPSLDTDQLLDSAGDTDVTVYGLDIMGDNFAGYSVDSPLTDGVAKSTSMESFMWAIVDVATAHDAATDVTTFSAILPKFLVHYAAGQNTWTDEQYLQIDQPTIDAGGTSFSWITSQQNVLWDWNIVVPNAIDYAYDPTMYSLDARILQLSGAKLIAVAPPLDPTYSLGMPLRNVRHDEGDLHAFPRGFYPRDIRMALREAVNPLIPAEAGDGNVRIEEEHFKMQPSASVAQSANAAFGHIFLDMNFDYEALRLLENAKLTRSLKRQG